jgi:hypothetical protein
MKTSIVIPLASNGFGSRWNDNELRYCLRSVQQYLTGYGEIFIIGKAPKWCKNIIEIPAPDDDKTYWKERNIYRKILKACEDSRVTKNFLFMNDDHFLLAPFEAGKFPNYYDGFLSDHEGRSDQYGNTVRNTCEVAHEYTRYFDIHAPIVYNKELFKYVFANVDWNRKYGYCIKSVYCQRTAAVGIRYPDLKIRIACPAQRIKELIKDRLWFSIDNKAREGGMEGVLRELYPNPSRYER